MNNLEISTIKQDDELILTCSGRLDANKAVYLNDVINRLVRDGSYHLSLDLTDIEYLSSAGIRTLVTQYKNLKTVNGHLTILKMSENVQHVLNMVGMADMLSQQPVKIKSPEAKEEHHTRMEMDGYLFSRKTLIPDGKTTVELFGHPDLIFQSGFKSEHARVATSDINHFAIGSGAIGVSFEECKNRFGEYIMMGKSVAYLPGDGSKKPDYLISSGKLVVSLTELFGLHFQGNFSSLIRFDPVNTTETIGISQLAETLVKITDLDQMAIVIIAESDGLMGTSLNVSPVDGKKIFSFPEIKETVNFTTEPAHFKMLTVNVGCITARVKGDADKFFRPLLPGKSLSGHFHSAVFPYIPLKKSDIDLNETLDYIFNNSELTDILHLTNDTREVTGQGESHFTKGFCWVVPVESFELH
jgi:anti-anti-sigma factor